MLLGAESCASQGTHSEKKKKKKKKGFYYSSKKNLDRFRMKNANKEFKFRGPSKLLDFGNTDIADIASLFDGALQDVQEVEEVMIVDFNKGACATKVNIGLTPACWNHYVYDMHIWKLEKFILKVQMTQPLSNLEICHIVQFLICNKNRYLMLI